MKRIRINWLWFFLSIFVYPVVDIVLSIILTALIPTTAIKYSLITYLGIFFSAFIVVISGKKSTMWDAILGIILFSFLYTILNQNYVFHPLMFFVCLLLGFFGAFLGETIKSKKMK
jgi:hypothetical protein